ncbi:MAG: hypothetical protein RIR02_1550, partial [Pseudomonadota bacterium]
MQSLGRRLALSAMATPSQRSERTLFNPANRPRIYQPTPKLRNAV